MFNFQSHVAARARATKPMSAGQATDSVMPIAFDKGSQKTEKPYAMPMHRWMARAAGGTSQRLKPGPAIVRSRARNPGTGSASVVAILLCFLEAGCVLHRCAATK